MRVVVVIIGFPLIHFRCLNDEIKMLKHKERLGRKNLGLSVYALHTGYKKPVAPNKKLTTP